MENITTNLQLLLGQDLNYDVFFQGGKTFLSLKQIRLKYSVNSETYYCWDADYYFHFTEDAISELTVNNGCVSLSLR